MLTRIVRIGVGALVAAGVVGSAAVPHGVQAKVNGTLRVATTAAVTTWDPSLSSSTEVEYMANVYQGLTVAGPPGSKPLIRPQLATSWKHSKNGLTWTFNLRHGVYFHDGTLMTAKSVINSINYINKQWNNGTSWAAVKKMTAPNKYTVVFHLTYPARLDYIASAEYLSWIFGPKVLTEPASWFAAGHDDGTGPYKVSNYQADRQVVLKAFPKYWGGWSGSHYKTIVSSIISESAVQQEMVQSGQADIAKGIPINELSSIQANPSLKAIIQPSNFYYLLYFNTKRKPLNKVLVRQALSYAIPYQSIIKVATAGRGKQSRGPIPYGLYPHDNHLPQYTYNLTKAKALLKKAGYPHGGFNLTLTYAAENTTEAQYAPLIKESFAKIGVGVTIKSLLFNSQWALAKGDPKSAQDMFLLLTWPSYDDDFIDLTVYYECQKPTTWNMSYYCNSTFDNMVNKAVKLEVSKPKKARQLFNQAQALLVKQAPVAWLYQDISFLVTDKQVAGVTANASYPFVTFYYPMHPA